MAKDIIVQVCGGEKKRVEGEHATVDDVRKALGLDASHTATVEGEPADPTTPLKNCDFVGFAKATAGGC